MAKQTTAEKNLAIINAAMADNAGVGSVTVDGTTVSYSSPSELMKLRDYWSRRVAQEKGAKPRVSTLRLSGGW